MAESHGKTSAGKSSSSSSSQRFGPYQVGETIGRGTFAKVKIAVHETTKVRVALKIIPLKVMETDPHSALKIKREIKVMKVLKHPHIVHLYDVVKTKHDIVLVVEFVSGGELFDYISRKGKLDEAAARSLFQQLSAAVAYCHRCNIVHRDIKPENIMLEHATKNIKLTDFGLSSIIHDGRFFETSCGTPNYASPEVVTGALYGTEADVWSCGVVLFAMVSGTLPFDETSVSTLFKKIQTADYTMPQHFSPELKDLIRKMLVVSPLERATMEQVLEHPWLRPFCPMYLLNLHYDAVHDTMRFAKGTHTDLHLDEEVVRVIASRFRTTVEHVADVITADEESIPSMRAIIVSEDRPNQRKRYPAANYFETFSNILDSKLWPTPLEIPAADICLKEEMHDMVVSYRILLQKKQNKLGPEESLANNRSFSQSENASFAFSQSQQGYGSLNANSLHQVSANTSFTGSSLKESITGPRIQQTKHVKGKPSLLTQLSMAPEAQSPSSTAEDFWNTGYDYVSAPFLPLRSANSKHTILGSIFKVPELPVELLRTRKIDLHAYPKRSNSTLKRPGAAATAADGGSMLLQPQQQGAAAAAGGTAQLRAPLQARQPAKSPTRPDEETALDALYRAETAARFGNDFIRNGVLFTNSTLHKTLKHVYEVMKEEGLLWKVIYDYYFSCVRFPGIKIQVKVYKVTATEQLVDVKVSVQSGMAGFDVAMSVLDRLRTRAVLSSKPIGTRQKLTSIGEAMFVSTGKGSAAAK